MADLSRLQEINQILTDYSKNHLYKLHKIAALCRSATGADRASIFCSDRNRKTLWTVVADEVKGLIEIPSDRGIVGAAFYTKKPILANDLRSSEIHFRDVDQSTGYQTLNLLAYPIIGYNSHALGVIELMNKPGGFDPEDEKLIHYAANQISVFIEILLEQGTYNAFD